MGPARPGLVYKMILAKHKLQNIANVILPFAISTKLASAHLVLADLVPANRTVANSMLALLFSIHSHFVSLCVASVVFEPVGLAAVV